MYKLSQLIKTTFILLLVGIMSSATVAQKHNKKVNIKKLDKYYQKALNDWNVPGMAVAIVKDNTVVLEKGYGVREVNKEARVDENTSFAIASNTKAFTVAALAILVDEGKINWSDKVTKYLPWFKLYNPYVTQEMTIRDLLCHRSGLKTFSGDLLWYGSNYSRQEVIRRAQYLKPKYGFREHFGYSNIMYLTAGEIIPVVTGMSWDDFLKEKLFIPLHMERTNTSVSCLSDMDNVASPHTKCNGEVISIPYVNWDNVGPAGSINSNVNDMANWIKMQLNSGVFNQDTIFSKQACIEMRNPNTPQRVSEGSKRLWPSIHTKAYAMGWSVFDYHGKQVVTHNGGYDGMISQTVLVPEENFGFVILTNSLSSMYYPLMYKTLDTYLSDSKQDWSEMFLAYEKRNSEYEKEQKIKEDNKRIKNTTPSLPLEDYVGIYGGDIYGNAEVSLKDGALVLQFVPTPLFTGKLTHWHYDTFEVEFYKVPSLPKGKVNFVIDADGSVEEMRVDVPNPDFDFTELKFMKIE